VTSRFRGFKPSISLPNLYQSPAYQASSSLIKAVHRMTTDWCLYTSLTTGTRAGSAGASRPLKLFHRVCGMDLGLTRAGGRGAIILHPNLASDVTARHWREGDPMTLARFGRSRSRCSFLG